MQTYSQHEEQSVILRCVGGKVGRFLDIGAADGVTFSNTRALAEAGWGGVCVEASPGQFVALQRLYGHHPDVMIVAGAVHPCDSGVVRFYDTPDLLGTTDEKNMEKWRGYTDFSAIYVAQITTAHLLTALPGPYHVISIDTEGTSLAVAKSLPLHELQTQVICVEHDEQSVEAANWGRSVGFRTAYLDGNNIILERA